MPLLYFADAKNARNRMTPVAAGRAPQQRWLAMLVIIALHVAGVLYWPQRQQGHASQADAGESAVFLVPERKQAPAITHTATAASKRQAPTRAARPKTETPPPAIRLIPAEPAVAAEEPPVAAKSAEQITLQAKRDIGKIDRELRQASLDMAQRNLVFNLSQREKGIAEAFIERGPPKIIEEVMSDGRRRSRIGNKCAYMESNGLVGARDVFKSGVRTVWGAC